MIRISNLEKSFSSDFRLEIGELHIEPGSRVALVGMNGSGKSTLLRLAAGLLRPDGGEIAVSAPKEKIGYLPQAPYAFRGTAEYNVCVGLKDRSRADAAIKTCALETLRGKKMKELSGGERQRVFLARMLAGDYRLLLLDEPMSAADLQTGAYLCELLKTHCEKTGATLVFSTHLPRQAFETAEKIALLDRGRLAEWGGAEDLRAPKTEFGKLFLNQWNV